MCEVCIQTHKDVELSRLRKILADERRAHDAEHDSTNALQKTIDELRSQLRNIQQQNPSGGQIATDSLFLKRLPAEIRNKIYKLLLVNPQLGQKGWIGENTKYGASFNYGLSPTLLRTCRKIYDEALPILYGSNTFILVCHRKMTFSFSWLPQSPITRYIDLKKYENVIFDFNQIPFINKIKRWRVITGNPCIHMVASQGSVQFCRTISKEPLLNLEVFVLLKDDPSAHMSQQNLSFQHMMSVEKAMSVLRNVQRLALCPAQPSDLTTCIATRHKPWYPAELNLYQDVQIRCRRLVTSDSAVEKVFEMNYQLLAYAQTFERSEQIRAEMNSIRSKPSLTPSVDDQDQIFPMRSLYRDGGIDVLESLLIQAESASASQENSRLKAVRT